jgi:uncharacterized protein (TIGR01244 family)
MLDKARRARHNHGMTQILHLTPDFAVTAQPVAADFQTFKAAGFTTVICNRPDGEEAGQLTMAEAQAICADLGLTYIAIPYQGRPGADAVAAYAAALQTAQGPVIAHCKSGTRSSYGWALAMAHNGMPVDDILQAAAKAGKDVTPLFA